MSTWTMYTNELLAIASYSYQSTMRVKCGRTTSVKVLRLVRSVRTKSIFYQFASMTQKFPGCVLRWGTLMLAPQLQISW
jgi:hypothetical protein